MAAAWLERFKGLWVASYQARILALVIVVANVVGAFVGRLMGWQNALGFFTLRGAQSEFLFDNRIRQVGLILYAFGQRDLLRGCVEISLAWCAAALLEQHVSSRQWRKIVLLGVPLTGLLTVIAARLATINGSAAGSGVIAAISLCALSIHAPKSPAFPGLLEINFRQLRNRLLPLGVLVEVIDNEKMAILTWLLAYPATLIVSGQLGSGLKSLVARPQAPLQTPVQGATPAAQSPAALAPNPVAAARSSDPQLYDVKLVGFSRHGEEGAELLQQHFGLDAERSQQLLASLPWVVKRCLPRQAADELAARFRAIGADVELVGPPAGSSATTPAASAVPDEEARDGAKRSPCSWCGESAATHAQLCPSCGRSLLFDVFVQSRATDARERYRLARCLSEQLTNGNFSRARAALESNKALFEALTRAEYEDALTRATAIGVQLEVRPAIKSLPPLAGSSRRGKLHRWQLAALGAAALLLVAGPLGLLAMRGGTSQPVSAADISDAVLPGIVTISCRDQAGAGFLVAKRSIVTNEHVVCSSGLVTVRMHDGRKLTGEVKKRDPVLDLALVEVEQDGRPLTLGDAGGVRQGDAIYVVGNPQGLSFTIGRGLIGHARRSFGEVVLLQLDASVNPGNSGGPLVNELGEVIGVVTLKARDTDGVGFAVPINYAYQDGATLALAAPANADAERWKATRIEANAVAARERSEDMDRPALLRAACIWNDSTVRCREGFVAMASESPTVRTLKFRIEVDGEEVCTLSADVGEWRKAPQGEGEVRHPLLGKGLNELIYGARADFGPLACIIENGDVNRAYLVVADGLDGADRLELRYALR